MMPDLKEMRADLELLGIVAKLEWAETRKPLAGAWATKVVFKSSEDMNHYKLAGKFTKINMSVENVSNR